MRVLVACEFSGIVRDAFRDRGHDAVSCDLLPAERPGPHIQADVLTVLGDGWDMMLAFPPCTYLAVSGARWHSGTGRQHQALEFARALMDASVPRIALENPVGAINSHIRRPDMILQPWQYGHRETKATCLWLKNLPPLLVSDVWSGPYEARVHRMPERKDRWKDRSRTLSGVAAAMAGQWGALECAA